jgi:uncharacterized SAM-binding protein YcdF (DUF218 family)
MGEVWTVLKGLIDPFFILFVVLVASSVIVLRNIRKKSDALILLFCIILAYGAGIAPVANYLCYVLERDYIIDSPSGYQGDLDAIVVLGNGTKEIKSLRETFSMDMGSLRILHAVTVYRRTGAGYFVCSGKGKGQLTEAQVLARAAESLGIPPEKIRLEQKSHNTAENAAGINQLFGNRKINIGLVTSAFHMRRSEREFRKYFDHVVPLPAHFLYASPSGNIVMRYLPQSAELYKTSIAVKEIIAQWWYHWK